MASANTSPNGSNMRRHGEDVGGSHHLGDVTAVAEEPHPVLDAEIVAIARSCSR